ncbi:MAG: hypothetical protein V4526_00815 [Patescibacteria group bacterium]
MQPNIFAIASSVSALEHIVGLLEEMGLMKGRHYFAHTSPLAIRDCVKEETPQLMVMGLVGTPEDTATIAKSFREVNAQLVCICLAGAQFRGPFEALVKIGGHQDQFKAAIKEHFGRHLPAGIK